MSSSSSSSSFSRGKREEEDDEGEEKVTDYPGLIERDFSSPAEAGLEGLLRNSQLDVSSTPDNRSYPFSTGDNRQSSILKKNSTASSGATRQSMLSVHFGEENETERKETGERGGGEEEEGMKKKKSSSQHKSSSSSISQRGGSRLSEAEIRHREDLRKSMENLNAELQILSISDTSSGSTDDDKRLLNGLDDVDDPELSHKAREMISKRRWLVIGVTVTAVILLILLIILALLTLKQKLEIWDLEESEKIEEKCRVSEWSEWSTCPTVCGLSQSQRKRQLEVVGSDISLCPSLEESRDCEGECRAFVLARSTTELLTDRQLETFTQSFRPLKAALQKALDVSGDRLTLSVMKTDIGTGSRYWHLEFVLYPEYHGKINSFQADPGRYPDDILN
ncbi:thrombospondin type 1 domain-containing protein, partial [Cystoisospora suis]